MGTAPAFPKTVLVESCRDVARLLQGTLKA